jgi:ribosomal protein L12E/L44/L45/RPP1/RPP2
MNSLGVLRPGDIAKLTLDEMANVGVKKIHARRIKSHPTVFEDAALMEKEQQELLSEAADETTTVATNVSTSTTTKKGGSSTAAAAAAVEEEEDHDEEALKQKLIMLIDQAEALGLSGEEVSSAKEALAKIESLSKLNNNNNNNNKESPMVSFLRDMGDEKYMSYVSTFADMGVTRPGQLMDVELNDLKKAGVKVLHARKIKSSPAVFMDAADIAEEVEKLNSKVTVERRRSEGEFVVVVLEDENDMEVDGWENFGSSFTPIYSDEDSDSDSATNEEGSLMSFNDNDGDGDDRTVATNTRDTLNHQLTELLAQAKELGLSGPEIEAAKKTLGIA